MHRMHLPRRLRRQRRLLHATTGACTGGEPCYGDVDRDGDIDVSDLLELLSDFGAGGGGSSDLDVSGVVDVADLLAVLSRFGAAC